MNINYYIKRPVAFAKASNLANSIKLLTHYAKGTPLLLINKYYNFDCL